MGYYKTDMLPLYPVAGSILYATIFFTALSGALF